MSIFEFKFFEDLGIMNNIIQKHEFRYVESGVGQPIIILHGLMGGLSNFSGVMNYLSLIHI